MCKTPTGRYLSTAQAGEFLGVTPSRIHRLVQDGLLEVKDTRLYKFGKNYYFDRTDVERLLPRIPGLKRKWQAEEDARLGAKRAAFKSCMQKKKPGNTSTSRKSSFHPWNITRKSLRLCSGHPFTSII